MKRLVEIRSYNLAPGRRADFHRLVVEKSMPLLRKWKVDVVAFGPSPQDEDSYYLIRAYSSLDDRKASQDAFYGSADWQEWRKLVAHTFEGPPSVEHVKETLKAF